MKGYSDGKNLHITFEGEESLQFVILLGEGIRAVKKWNLKNKELQEKINREVDEFWYKVAVITHRYKETSEA